MGLGDGAFFGAGGFPEEIRGLVMDEESGVDVEVEVKNDDSGRGGGRICGFLCHWIGRFRAFGQAF